MERRIITYIYLPYMFSPINGTAFYFPIITGMGPCLDAFKLLILHTSSTPYVTYAVHRLLVVG